MAAIFKFSFELVEYNSLLEFTSEHINRKVDIGVKIQKENMCWVYRFVCPHVDG